MGILSLFGKKEDDRQDKTADKTISGAKRGTSATVERASVNAKRDAVAARATALKIDAIESEMSSEFKATTTLPLVSPTISPKTVSAASAPSPGKPAASPQANPKPGPTLQKAARMESSTDFLLNGSSTIGSVGLAASEVAAAVEEAAIMFANGQFQVTKQLLHTAIEEDRLGDAAVEAWLMLFDLYQITGNQQEFESLSLAYASKFETSPPAWVDSARQSAPQASPSRATSTVSFSGKLDASSAKNIERTQKLAETHRTLRLEFMRIAEVDAAGCGLLLSLLKKLQKSGHDLILAGALELAGKIRATIEVGRRDDGEDAWLLLLEILQLLNREQEFEETSIDYCVTFEVSPPAFVAPKNKVTTAAAGTEAGGAPSDSLMMPAIIEGKIDNLILSIVAHSDEHNPAIIDCSRLNRIDFNAAGRLLTGLSPFCGNGKTIEFHHVNHLVLALFNVIGLQGIARILPRK